MKLIDVKEAAKFIGITEQGIRKAIKEKRLLATKYGNSYAIKKLDVCRFRNKRNPTRPGEE